MILHSNQGYKAMNGTTQEKRPILLSEIFAETDTVEFAGLKVTKKPGEVWSKAKAYIHGEEITLQPRGKQLLALLISQRGEPVTKAILKENFYNKTNIEPEAIENAFTIQISIIKKQILEQKPEAKEVLDQIRPSNLTRGETGRRVPLELRGSYYINEKPELTAE